MKVRIAALGAAALAGVACGTPSAARPQGERLYRQNCYACHAIEPGGTTPAGPTLHAIVGRPIAADPAFRYSPALQRLAEEHRVWSSELLERFIADPEGVAPGTQMGLPGLDDADARRTLIDWLGDQS